MYQYHAAADTTLSQRLQDEIKYEKEAVVEDSEPEFLKSFKLEQIWTVGALFLARRGGLACFSDRGDVGQ